jgi:DNA-binding response OmpR family regulator
MSTTAVPPHARCLPVVDVSIRYLRRKRDERVGRPIIRTIRGVGYQIPDGAR